VAAIGLFQMVYNIPECCFPATYFPAGMVGSVQVFIRKTIILQVKGGEIFTPGPNRIGLSEKVPPLSVAIDQVDDFKFFIESEGFRFRMAVITSGQIKALEKMMPAGIDRTRIFPVFLIQLLDGLCIEML